MEPIRPACAREHEEEIEAGREECFERLGCAIEVPDGTEGCSHPGWNDERNGVVKVVVQA
jgi:hypothetical protein